MNGFNKAAGLGALLVTLAMTASSAAAQSGTQAGTFGIERGTGKIICTGDGDGRGEGQEVLDESYARSAAWDRMVLGEGAMPCAPEAPVFEQIDDGMWERTAAFSGTDSAGLRAYMRIYVLEDRFAWAFGSASNVEELGGKPAKLSFVFGRPMFLSEFCAGDGAVAIGAASFEGDRQANRGLSQRRARTLGNEMQRLTEFCGAQTPPALHGVTLGEFTSETPCMRAGTCAGNTTAPQRRVVLIGIADAQPGINLAEAVKDALGTQTARNVLSISEYDVFDFASY